MSSTSTDLDFSGSKDFNAESNHTSNNSCEFIKKAGAMDNAAAHADEEGGGVEVSASTGKTATATSSSKPKDPRKDANKPEVYEGVALCRKYAIVIRNHARHDVEAVRKMLRDMKRYESDARLRPLWISGFGGQDEVARVEDGKKKKDPAPEKPKKIRSLSALEVDPRNKMLMRHVKLQCRNVSLYIADETDPERERLYRAGVYMFDGFQTAQTSPGCELEVEEDIHDISNDWDLSEEDIEIMKAIRMNLHMRFYLSPEPPLHPDRFNKDGKDSRRVNVGTVTTLTKIRGAKNKDGKGGSSDVVLEV